MSANEVSISETTYILAPTFYAGSLRENCISRELRSSLKTTQNIKNKRRNMGKRIGKKERRKNKKKKSNNNNINSKKNIIMNITDSLRQVNR